MGAGLGVLLYRGVFRRLLAGVTPSTAGKIEGNSLLLFFGLSILMQNIAALAFTPNNRAYAALGEVYRIGGVAMTGNRLAALLIAGGCSIAAALFLSRSVAGLAMRAVIERREAASIVGVDVDRVQGLSFAVGFGSAALAGVLMSMLEQFSPFSGFPFTIAGFIVIILGGLGNVTGGLLAALAARRDRGLRRGVDFGQPALGAAVWNLRRRLADLPQRVDRAARHGALKPWHSARPTAVLRRSPRRVRWWSWPCRFWATTMSSASASRC